MTIFLLDSNILIDAINGRDSRAQLLDRFIQQGVLLACTSIVVTEVYRGMRPHEAQTTGKLLRSLEFFPVTWEIAQLAGALLGLWRQRGHTLSLPDATIAAVCLAEGLTLVTGNRKHFPMPELKMYDLG